MSRPTGDVESELVDLTEESLAKLPVYDEKALAPIVARLLRQADDPDIHFAGYNPQRAD